MSSSEATPRAQGLDTLRALAIVLVFVYHYRVFVSPEPASGWVGTVGWTGVDLFFVLSGFLIADSLLAGLARGRRLALGAFYMRRGLRTWPLFWVVLAAYFTWPADLGGRTPPPLWTFLTFTQNVGLRPGTAFSHAWSLCIEEQFYLVLPLVLAVGSRLGGRRLHGWLLLLALLALGIAARTVLWQAYSRQGDGRDAGFYYPYIYYATLCRFDEFLPGVAVALLKNLHAPTWARLTRHGQALLALGAAAMAGVWALSCHFYHVDGEGYGFFMTAFGYSLMALAFALLVVAALSPGSWLHRVRVPGAYPLAAWSYAIYLSHKGIAHVVQAQAAPWALSPWALLGLVTLACLLGGVLLHKAVEMPFMALRGGWFPSHFAPASPSRQEGEARPRQAAPVDGL